MVTVSASQVKLVRIENVLNFHFHQSDRHFASVLQRDKMLGTKQKKCVEIVMTGHSLAFLGQVCIKVRKNHEMGVTTD